MLDCSNLKYVWCLSLFLLCLWQLHFQNLLFHLGFAYPVIVYRQALFDAFSALTHLTSIVRHCHPCLIGQGYLQHFCLKGLMDGDDTNQRKDTNKHQFMERWGSRVWGDSFQRVNRGLARQLTGWSCSAGWKWSSQAGIQVWELTSWWERVENMRSHREHLYFKERRQVEVRISKGHY